MRTGIPAPLGAQVRPPSAAASLPLLLLLLLLHVAPGSSQQIGPPLRLGQLRSLVTSHFATRGKQPFFCLGGPHIEVQGLAGMQVKAFAPGRRFGAHVLKAGW